MRTHWLQEADRLNFTGQIRPAAINRMALPLWPGQYTSFLGRLVHTSLPRDRADKQVNH